MGMALKNINKLDSINAQSVKKNVPVFRTGDTVKVHAKIVEGNKERIQVFEGLVIKRHGGNGLNATFTVRKVSYNVGVERTFMLHSPRIDKLEVVSRGSVRRARLFYLRPLRGKASRIKSKILTAEEALAVNGAQDQAVDVEAPAVDTGAGEAAESAAS